MQYDGGVLDTIDDRWLHFVDHMAIGLIPDYESFVCSFDYLDWFRCVSRLYITPRVEDDRPHVAMCRRARSSMDRDPLSHHIRIMFVW